MKRCSLGMAFLLAMLLAEATRGGDATVDSVLKTKLMGDIYNIAYAGTLSLKDTGGGFEQFAKLVLEVKQAGGTSGPVGIVDLKKPEMKKNGDGTYTPVDGSYFASINVTKNPNDPNWKAYATIVWYKDSKSNTGEKTGEKAFTVP